MRARVSDYKLYVSPKRKAANGVANIRLAWQHVTWKVHWKESDILKYELLNNPPTDTHEAEPSF